MTKVLCDGRLVVEPYPTKKRLEDEDLRIDGSGSSLFIHVEINHDFMSTVDLYNLLVRDYRTSMLDKYYRDKLELIDAFLSNILPSSPNLIERHDEKKDWSKPEDSMNWHDSQIYIWEGNSDRFHYNMWLNWCKNILKKKALRGTREGKTYDPYEGLRLRVRTEFHDQGE